MTSSKTLNSLEPPVGFLQCIIAARHLRCLVGESYLQRMTRLILICANGLGMPSFQPYKPTLR